MSKTPKHKTPVLVPVDLSKAKKHECPGIEIDVPYLVKYDGEYETGTFDREWYGLNFLGVFPAGAQFNAPGWNASRWEAVWRIVDSDLEMLAAQKNKKDS